MATSNKSRKNSKRKGPTFVYVAGPYTSPYPVYGTRNAVEVGTELMKLGYVPYVPHLTMFWDFLTPMPYKVWLVLDAEWLTRCDAVLRLPGKSSGADKEVALAVERGIPVYHTVKELCEKCPALSNPLITDEEIAAHFAAANLLESAEFNNSDRTTG